MDNCIFCKIAKGEIPCNKIYEDEHTIAFLDISPVNNGHTLVIPKEHAEKIYELSDKSSEALIKTVKKIGKAVEKSMCCDFNLLNNNGSRAGQVVKHVHIHIIPRTGKDAFSIPWPTKKYENDEDKEILRKIKGNI